MSETKRYEVMFPHARTINGQLMMFEPMFTGVIGLPDDEETKMAVEAGWLRPVPTEPDKDHS